MNFIDVSRELSPAHPYWPGDTAFSFDLVSRIESGASVNVGCFQTSTHNGTHVDAPWHYNDVGLKLHDISLQVFIGDCLVIDATGLKVLLPDLIAGKKLPTRVLFKTGQKNSWLVFPESWAVPDPSLLFALGEQGVRLFGTDAPSVDELTSKDLPGHAACNKAGIFILESLALENVEPGEYRLFCLPLKLRGADAAPARVILERK